MADEIDTLRERVTELELKYMHQTRFVDELSSVLAEQQRAIDDLTRGLRTLREQLMRGDDGAIKDEPPPHY